MRYVWIILAFAVVIGVMLRTPAIVTTSTVEHWVAEHDAAVQPAAAHDCWWVDAAALLCPDQIKQIEQEDHDARLLVESKHRDTKRDANGGSSRGHRKHHHRVGAAAPHHAGHSHVAQIEQEEKRENMAAGNHSHRSVDASGGSRHPAHSKHRAAHHHPHHSSVSHGHHKGHHGHHRHHEHGHARHL